MEQSLPIVPADRAIPQPQRVHASRRDGKKRERPFEIVPPRKDDAARAPEEHAPPPAAHEDGTGSRLDVTA